MKGRVQVSEQTAELLFKANKHHWLTKREDKIKAKGKGSLQTYWLDITASGGSIAGSSLDQEEDSPDTIEEEDEESLDGTALFEDEKNSKRLSSRHARLVDWNAECLLRLLKQIAVRREANRSIQGPATSPEAAGFGTTNGMVIDEVKECIVLPCFNPALERRSEIQDAGGFQMKQEVEHQLRGFISTICCKYKSNNHFHNFEHASHVTM